MSTSEQWWWWGSSGAPPDPVQALLDEAAVRFDFSQYDDIDNMVDVNNGYGPLVPGFTGVTSSEFNGDGLHLVGNPATIVPGLAIEGVPGPIEFNGDGLTVMDVKLVGAAHDRVNVAFSRLQAWCLNDTDGAPGFIMSWSANTAPDDLDAFGVNLQDGPPDTNNIVNATYSLVPATDNSLTGVFISVMIVDVDSSEVRFRGINSVNDTTHTFPFGYSPPDYVADPHAVENFYPHRLAITPSDLTFEETLVWNRALTPSEVDTLVDHFTA